MLRKHNKDDVHAFLSNQQCVTTSIQCWTYAWWWGMWHEYHPI